MNVVSTDLRSLKRARKLRSVARFTQVARRRSEAVIGGETPSKPGISSPTAMGTVSLISIEERHGRNAEKMASPSLSDDHLLGDTEVLSAMELRARFPAEANAHRNMLQRVKSRSAVVHPDFRQFRSFLKIVGPMPAKGATLDRVNNLDPEYAPAKVRWADRRTQNNNKGDTLTFFYSRTKDTYTTSRVAALQTVAAGTIRKRKERGWTDDEIIEGRRSKTSKTASTASRQKCVWGSAYEPERVISEREKKFEELARAYAEHRQLYGEEAMMAPIEVLNDCLPENCSKATEQGYEQVFRRIWPDHRHHVNFSNLPQSQRELIKKIDPDFYAAWVNREAAKADFENAL